MNKIYIFKLSLPTGDLKGQWVGYACAEDGERLVSHLLDHPLYDKNEMGITGINYHSVYDMKYPEGYVLEDLLDMTELELQQHAGFNVALDKGIESGEL